jgi:hypothetical protein
MNKVFKFSKDRTLILAAGMLAIGVIGLAVIGGVRSYSPVPFWDMWDGYLEFFLRITDGDSSAWWTQHNEHRIMLARLLFWADIKWFGGTGWFLIAVNYFLAGANALVFWRILRDAAATETPATGEILLGLMITAWLFLWSQEVNLTWAFQSQFFLAQLLPLCALYWLQKSIIGIKAGRRSFLIACGFGLASVGTMANGILALPLMTFYALLTRQSLLRTGALSILSVGTIFFYFNDYHAPVERSLLQDIKENPFGFAQYVLLYLGGPFFYLFGKGGFGKVIALEAGLALIVSSAWFAIKSPRKPQEMTLQLAMLFFILYIVGTAFGTAAGRLILGVDHALSSRYTTPALMAWCALLVLYSPGILTSVRARGTKRLLPFAALALLMIPLQINALRTDDKLFERKIAQLALRVKDQTQIEHVHWSAELALSIAEKAAAQNLSIFAMYPFSGAREQLGTFVQQQRLTACQGHLDSVEAIDGDARFVRIRGWMFNSTDRTYPHVIRFLNNQGKVVGYALTGQTRLDVANAIDKKALLAGYRGYLLANQMGAALNLRGESPSCQMQANAPKLPFSLTSTKPLMDSATNGSANILPGNQWPSSDIARSVIDGTPVYGSIIRSDADVEAERGDPIFYRSGLAGGYQSLKVSSSALLPVNLPGSTEWALLNFSSLALPDGEFVVKFSDDGTKWGKATIALKEADE